MRSTLRRGNGSRVRASTMWSWPRYLSGLCEHADLAVEFAQRTRHRLVERVGSAARLPRRAADVGEHRLPCRRGVLLLPLRLDQQRRRGWRHRRGRERRCAHRSRRRRCWRWRCVSASGFLPTVCWQSRQCAAFAAARGWSADAPAGARRRPDQALSQTIEGTSGLVGANARARVSA